jgi:hypothetical protein
VPKSQSNNLRYDEPNGIPLTNKEHARHHLSGDPSIVAQITLIRGKKWLEDLQTRRRIICKHNLGYLETIKQDLEGKLREIKGN